ncbi:NAD-dependent epimerase/dehydratase family protein [Polluticaenibacter yanchengensis]|uniref:NAD-dependent epimerase/dehydratase family protein n=1 Tax=Polluticaenibacter yanchengensis TaxID=3014562 RepID=A0ABT4UMF4_9BACT|nr:NAD-dependent epimerase/dehydratase family protein [Chitinophagaceae bacterium LY-5]
MNKILVLGGSGFIGKNLLSIAKDSNNQLFVITKSDISQSIEFKHCHFIEGSIKDTDLIKTVIIENDITNVIHLNSNLIPSSTADEFQQSFEDIVLPTFKIIDLAAILNVQFIFLSSGGTVYGKSDSKIDETHSLNPINYYGYHKTVIEDYILFKHRTEKLNYLILRPSNVFGEYQKFESNQGFISVAIHKLSNNESLEIWGDGSVTRDYLHVQDLVDIIFKLINANVKNEVLNICSGIGYTLNEVIKFISLSLNTNPKITYKPARNIDLNFVVLNNQKLFKFIDHDFITLENGIRRQVNYYKSII